MGRHERWFTRSLLAAVFMGWGTAMAAESEAFEPVLVVVNPYAHVDWDTYDHHRAALHVHTLQSDGYHMVDEVVRAYHGAGFTILSITDHDNNAPNLRVEMGEVPEEEASPYPLDPKPDGFPHQPTWPWTDYGGPDPAELGMVGIEGNELSLQHHANSYFNDYGAPATELSDEEQLRELRGVQERDGLMIWNHPHWPARPPRQPVAWYQNHFEQFDHLIGMEITNCGEAEEPYTEGLWDQLLARLMPERPVWGFGNDDMHALNNARETYTVFPLGELTIEAVRDAMEQGQFYFHKANRTWDVREGEEAMSRFPVIERIAVDNEAGTITIEASNYDIIRWISAPESLEPVADITESNAPHPLGRVVHEGETIAYRETPGVAHYVRAELHRTENGRIHRTFTNPFGIGMVR